MDDKYKILLDGIVAIVRPIVKAGRHTWSGSSESSQVKLILTEIIKEWLRDKIIEGHVRFDGLQIQSKESIGQYRNSYDTVGLSCESVAIYNNVGGLEKKSLWLNKLVLAKSDKQTYRVRSHRARTDRNYLSPLDTEFLEFFESLMEYVNDNCKN